MTNLEKIKMLSYALHIELTSLPLELEEQREVLKDLRKLQKLELKFQEERYKLVKKIKKII